MFEWPLVVKLVTAFGQPDSLDFSLILSVTLFDREKLKLVRPDKVAEAEAEVREVRLLCSVQLKRPQLVLRHLSFEDQHNCKCNMQRTKKSANHFYSPLQIRIQSTDARIRFEEIVKVMALEMERFQEEKTRDLGSILVNFARAQAQLAADTADAWRTLLPELDAVSQAELNTLNS